MKYRMSLSPINCQLFFPGKIFLEVLSRSLDLYGLPMYLFFNCSFGIDSCARGQMSRQFYFDCNLSHTAVLSNSPITSTSLSVDYIFWPIISTAETVRSNSYYTKFAIHFLIHPHNQQSVHVYLTSIQQMCQDSEAK